MVHDVVHLKLEERRMGLHKHGQVQDGSCNSLYPMDTLDW